MLPQKAEGVFPTDILLRFVVGENRFSRAVHAGICRKRINRQAERIPDESKGVIRVPPLPECAVIIM